MTLKELSQWFWSDDFWLPPNITWDHLVDTSEDPNIRFPSSSDLFYPIPMALVLIVIRYLVENQVFRPLGRTLGLKSTRKRYPDTNDILETAYKSKITGKKSAKQQEEILRLSHELQMPERKIERWLRQRAMAGKPSQLDKFAETGWRWFYYTGVFIWGVKCLWSKKWLWTIKDCWYNYPYHYVESDVWWWYMGELSFYWGLLITQFFDVKRKDFSMMFIHHAVTIGLMSFSWTCNFYKIGTLVLMVHDVSDIFLESAKLFKYGGAQKVSEVLFASFAASWFITRLGIYPTWIIYSATVEAPQLIQYFPGYFVFNALLSALLLLNIVWAYLICKVVYNSLMANETIANDIRSDTSEDGKDATTGTTDGSDNEALKRKTQ